MGGVSLSGDVVASAEKSEYRLIYLFQTRRRVGGKIGVSSDFPIPLVVASAEKSEYRLISLLHSSSRRRKNRSIVREYFYSTSVRKKRSRNVFIVWKSVFPYTSATTVSVQSVVDFSALPIRRISKTKYQVFLEN